MIYGKWTDAEFEYYINWICSLQRSIDQLQYGQGDSQSNSYIERQLRGKLYGAKQQMLKRVVALKNGTGC